MFRGLNVREFALMLFVNCVLFCLMLRLAIDAPADVRAILEQRHG